MRTCAKAKKIQHLLISVKGLSLAFLGLLCKVFPEHMKKYADPLLNQYLKYLHEQVTCSSPSQRTRIGSSSSW